MPLIVVTGSERGAGATTVAVGLAHRLAYAGHDVRLARLGGDPRAETDAQTFASLEFASAAAAPVTESDLQPGATGTTIVEAPPGADLGRLSALGATLFVIARTGEGPGIFLNHAKQPGPRQFPEDRLLAAPTVGDLATASKARVIARSATGDAAICEHIVIGAISHDSNQPYFQRFPRKAVVTRAEKVDIVLSALRAGDTECLILTGGSDPSPYILDRVAAARSTTLLLAPEGTVETVRDIENSFGQSPFSGAAKVERAGMLMAAALDDQALEALASVQAAAPTPARRGGRRPSAPSQH
jgi:BioD-like phosphotransacetylase family protein